MQHAPHAHAVFQLREGVVKAVRRHAAPRLQIPLVARVHDAHAVPALASLAVLLQNIQHLARALRVVGLDVRKALAVACEAAGHGGHAAHRRVQPGQLFQALAQLVAVVHAAAQNQLAVHLDAGGGKFVDIPQHLARAAVFHHGHAECRVHCVHRDIDGRNVHILDALHFFVAQVRQRDVVAEQKRKPLVVVLEIQRLAQALRHLVDKAEHALVAARVLFVDEIAFKIAAQRLVLALFHALVAQPARAHQRQLELRAGGVELIVQHVVDLVPVDGQQRAPRKGVLRSGAVLFRARDLYRHGSSPLSAQPAAPVHKSKGKDELSFPSIAPKAVQASFLMISLPL